MVELRSGTYGNYYGNTIGSSNPLNLEQMKLNAKYIRDYLINEGFTINSISAILGNMEIESSINPGRWENDEVGVSSNGFGLVQWTPSTNYIDWITTGDYTTMDNNLSRIIYEVNNNIQWISTSTYPLTFLEFKTSTSNPYDLALAFLYNYERPASLDQPIRGEKALYWYQYLTDTPYGVTINKNKFKWVLYANKLRNNLTN